MTALTVDHGLEDGSAERARHLVERMRSLGAAEAAQSRVGVGGAGRRPRLRAARYALLGRVAEDVGADVGPHRAP